MKIDLEEFFALSIEFSILIINLINYKSDKLVFRMPDPTTRFLYKL